MKITLLTLMVLLSLNALGSDIEKFASSLESEFGLDTQRLFQVEQRIRIKKPNAIQRWLMNRSGAEATYNDKTNTIVLRDKNWVKARVISLEDFPREQSYRFSIFASTIFHELMHADFDVLIKRSNSRADIALSNTQKWFSKNAPRFNAHIAAHEFFGYTASDIIYGIQTQTQDTLMGHGINHIKKECFPVKALKRIKKRLFKDGNIHFKDLESISDYSPRFTPNTVFVKGKSIDLVKLKMPRSIRSSIYQIFVDHYNAPSSSLELINRLEKKYGALLKECYSF